MTDCVAKVVLHWDSKILRAMGAAFVSLYGIAGQGWVLSFHVFTQYVKVTFFRGTLLRPVPPGASKHKDMRYFDIHEGATSSMRRRWRTG